MIQESEVFKSLIPYFSLFVNHARDPPVRPSGEAYPEVSEIFASNELLLIHIFKFIPSNGNLGNVCVETFFIPTHASSDSNFNSSLLSASHVAPTVC